MTGIDSWSTTPATNATADGGSINWAEGQPPSSVNNTARQMLADERSRQNDLIWFQYGTGDQGAGNIAVPSVYASGTSFTITGADVTTVYTTSRRLRAVGSGTGTIYGTISSSSYNSGNTKTTVNVTWDSGSLSNETLVISLSQAPITGKPVSGAGLSFPSGAITFVDNSGQAIAITNTYCHYNLIGKLCFVNATLVYGTSIVAAQATLNGLPFASINSNGAAGAFAVYGTAQCMGIVAFGDTVLSFVKQDGSGVINDSDVSGATLRFQFVYEIA